MKLLPVVVALKSDYSTLHSKLKTLFELSGGLGIRSGQKVVIKINLCDARTSETGAITHPEFLDALLKFLRENYESLEIYVVESDATVVLADEFVKWFGFLTILEKWNVKWVNLSKERKIKKKINGLYFKELELPEIFFNDIHFISLAKLKTNILTKVTLILKNQFGCLPEIEKNKYHTRIHDVIADINSILKPDFSIVDGIIAMGGAQGPAFGTPIDSNIIIGGRDPVAVDSFGAELLGFNPRFVPHISKASKLGIGLLEYKLVGDHIDNINFEINKLEMCLFRLGSSIKKRVMQRWRR